MKEIGNELDRDWVQNATSELPRIVVYHYWFTAIKEDIAKTWFVYSQIKFV
jgi:hypothetical protein